jgi:pimeloyl-ACP methyl ester carboxylesterase
MTRLLETTSYGEQTGIPLLIVHGLFGSGRNWRALAKHFSRRRRVLTVDLRNHGNSFWDGSNTYEDLAADLAAVIAAHGGVADVLGHSMGGKAAMVLALQHPDMVRRLLIADIAPVAYAHTQIDNIKAMQALPLEQITRRSEADALLQASIPEPAVRAFLLSSLQMGPEGNRWMLNLQALAANMPAIIGFPDVSGQYDGPAHFIYGGASDYVRPQYHARIRELFPCADFHKIAGAGHWVHAEKPREFIGVVEGLLGGENL